MNYCLDPEAVEKINRGHVLLTGEPYGLLNRSGLLSSLARPLGGYGGIELFPSPVAKAGALLHALAEAHPFRQGNKRTAWTAATTFLGLHGIGIDASDDAATEFVLSVVAGEHHAKSASLWFADRITIDR